MGCDVGEDRTDAKALVAFDAEGDTEAEPLEKMSVDLDVPNGVDCDGAVEKAEAAGGVNENEVELLAVTPKPAKPDAGFDVGVCNIHIQSYISRIHVYMVHTSDEDAPFVSGVVGVAIERLGKARILMW